MQIDGNTLILKQDATGTITATLEVARYMQSLTEPERVAAGWGDYSAELLALDLSAVPLLTAAEIFSPVV